MREEVRFSTTGEEVRFKKSLAIDFSFGLDQIEKDHAPQQMNVIKAKIHVQKKI